MFCLKLRRELTPGSISVKLFGEQEQDQNKGNNKRPPPPSPFLYGGERLAQRPQAGEQHPQSCRQLHSALQPFSALKGQAPAFSISHFPRNSTRRWDLPEEGVRGHLWGGPLLRSFRWSLPWLPRPQPCPRGRTALSGLGGTSKEA